MWYSAVECLVTLILSLLVAPLTTLRSRRGKSLGLVCWTGAEERPTR